MTTVAKPRRRKVYRSAVTGYFCSREDAERSPATTVSQMVRVGEHALRGQVTPAMEPREPGRPHVLPTAEPRE